MKTKIKCKLVKKKTYADLYLIKKKLFKILWLRNSLIIKL